VVVVVMVVVDNIDVCACAGVGEENGTAMRGLRKEKKSSKTG
jgi:hypothetical protein